MRPKHTDGVITIGTFDGIHHGHQMLLSHLSAKAQELNCTSMLVTFEPQPREYFRGSIVPARLTRFREKISILREFDLDYVLCIPFNETTSSTSADAVINEFLVRILGVKYLVVGDDFRFGRNAEGDYTMLQTAGDRLGFGVTHLGTMVFDHERVSSTRIRDALRDGDFQLAEKLLGRKYFMMGTVVVGQRMGRQLGTPTANIRLQRYRSALEGIFAVTVTGLDRVYEGSAYVGTRPTVDGTEPLLEVHLFDFDQDIYGKLITVTFHHKFRDDVRFDGLDALRIQIAKDLEMTRHWFTKHRAKSASVNPHWWWCFVGAAAIVVVDQYTKYVATAELLDGAVSVLPFLSFRYFCNTGAAFSILQGFTHFLTFVGVAFVIYFSWEIWRLRRIDKPPVLFVAALTLILAGAGGNLIDRALQGCVVDFIHLHYDWFNFPIFNVADSAVCIGAASWILAALLHREQPKSEVAEEQDPPTNS